MADYFTRFSVIVPLPTEAAQKYAVDLAEQARDIYEGRETPSDFPADLREVTEDWHFDTYASDSSQGWGLWLHSDTGGVDAVSAFIQHLLKQSSLEAFVTLEWSNDCSKPRTDAFGGGAAIITAAKIKTMTTSEWLHGQAAKIETQNQRQQ